MTLDEMERSNMPAAIGIDDEVEWNFAGVVRKIIRGRRILMACTLGGLVLGILVALVLPKWYAAEAVFLPPRASESMLPNFSSGATGMGMAASALLMQQDPSDVYLGMLGSRSVQDDVIDRVGLMAVYHAKTKTIARNALKHQSKFKVNKNSLISIDVNAG